MDLNDILEYVKIDLFNHPLAKYCLPVDVKKYKQADKIGGIACKSLETNEAGVIAVYITDNLVNSKTDAQHFIETLPDAEHYDLSYLLDSAMISISYHFFVTDNDVHLLMSVPRLNKGADESLISEESLDESEIVVFEVYT